MAFDLDPDIYRSASHQAMIAHLCGPFLGGAADDAITVSSAGVIDVPISAREPLVLVAPKASLRANGLRIRAKLLLPAAADISPALEFGPYTEQGSFLALFRPGVDPSTRTAAPFRIELKGEFISRGRDVVPPAIADVSTLVDVRLVQGALGKMIYLLGAEKQKIRRQGREIIAYRRLSEATGDALDRFGADLAVPRFSDRIRFDAPKKEIVTETLKDAGGNPIMEPDDQYRLRLALYYPMLVPNRKNVLALLNGPGAPGDPNKGPLSQLGLQTRIDLSEESDPFAVAIHIVADSAPARTNFFNYIRDVYLIWPSNAAAANNVHAKRFIPSAVKSDLEALRTRLRNSFNFGADMAIAPLLADTLDRLGRIRTALGIATKIDVTRAQDVSSSRYELGLGVDIKQIPAAELDQMRATLTATTRVPSKDVEIEALLAGLNPPAAAQDGEGRWLLRAAGFRTVHRINATGIYISHFPAFGLVLTEAAPVAGVRGTLLEARYQAPGDPGANAVIAAALAGAAPPWATAGEQPWTVLTDAAAQTAWGSTNVPPPAAINVLKAAGLPGIPPSAALATQLKALPPELLQTLKLGPQLSQAIIAGQPAAADRLRLLATLLRQRSINSILPLVTGPQEVVLVIGVIGLPQAGLNLSDRRSSGFRWYVVPVGGEGGVIKAIGSRTTFLQNPPDPKKPEPNVTAIVAIGYARQGLGDPYEVHVTPRDTSLLSLPQYEFLMNLLEHIYPVGIQINTFSLRREHVDLDGDGKADPLQPNLARTYRRFHRPRHRGEVAVPIDSK